MAINIVEEHPVFTLKTNTPIKDLLLLIGNRFDILPNTPSDSSVRPEYTAFAHLLTHEKMLSVWSEPCATLGDSALLAECLDLIPAIRPNTELFSITKKIGNHPQHSELVSENTVIGIRYPSTVMADLIILAPDFKYARDLLNRQSDAYDFTVTDEDFKTSLILTAINNAEQGDYHAMLLLGALSKFSNSIFDTYRDGESTEMKTILVEHGYNAKKLGVKYFYVTMNSADDVVFSTGLYAPSLKDATNILRSHLNDSCLACGTPFLAVKNSVYPNEVDIEMGDLTYLDRLSEIRSAKDILLRGVLNSAKKRPKP
jgi:hypothetical protein